MLIVRVSHVEPNEVKVSFAYPSRPDHTVLNESTFFFPAGDTTFLIGKSGSGKSTIGNLLMRFYEPSRGKILIDGDALVDIETNWLRNNITLVQQSSILFNETLRTNIAFGHRDHLRVSKDHVDVCAHFAALKDTISRLPNGLETKVGAGGSALSGGQKQRIALARARLRDTPILILDESTSALDHANKLSVTANIRQWRKGKTTIVITHDMSQIEDKDFVYVLESGAIVAEGYWENVAAGLEGNMEPKSPTSPSDIPLAAFDSELHRRPKSGLPIEHKTPRLPSVLMLSSPERKDSLDMQLDALATQPFLQLPESQTRTARLSRAVSRRMSGGATAFLGSYRQGTFTRFQSLYVAEPPKTTSPLPGDISYTETRVRSMSMHQAIAMKTPSDTTDLSTKPLPTPKVFETPVLIRRSSMRKSIEPESATTKISIRKILMTVWPNLNARFRLRLMLGFLNTIVHAAVPPAFSYVLVQLFSTFALKQGFGRRALIYSLAIMCIAVVDGFMTFFMHYLLETVAQHWVDELRVRAMGQVLQQPKAWFDKDQNALSTIVTTLDRNAEEMRNLLGRFAALVVIVASMMLVSIIWSMVMCWKLTLVAVATAPVLYLIIKLFGMVSSKCEAMVNTASENVGAVFAETFTDIRTVRSLTLESYFHKKYAKTAAEALSTGMRRAFYSGFFFGLSDTAVNFITALIFYSGARIAVSHEFTVKDILTSFSLILFSTASANSVVAAIPQISSSADTAHRLLHLARLQSDSHENHGRIRLDKDDPSALSGPISFVNLTFYYPTRLEKPVLCQMNLTISAGRCTAIVGASGSGKSTIASLLLGLYEPTADVSVRTASDASSGPASLTLSGRDIRTLHLPTLRSMVTVVPQNPVLFPMTVRENIIYGLDLNSGLTTATNIEKAARAAGIHDFIVSLPQGYATVIGEGGLGVSGGQSQRIVIARALVRQPKILILDEATSALDPESAALVKTSIRDLVRNSQGRVTIIVITHTKEMMKFADQVVVMEDGRVVEEGTYKALCTRKGKLWEMLKLGVQDAA